MINSYSLLNFVVFGDYYSDRDRNNNFHYNIHFDLLLKILF